MEDKNENMKALSKEELENVSGGAIDALGAFSATTDGKGTVTTGTGENQKTWTPSGRLGEVIL